MRFVYVLSQDGLEVVKGDAASEETALREALHYALQYAEDGPVKVHVERLPAEEE